MNKIIVVLLSICMILSGLSIIPNLIATGDTLTVGPGQTYTKIQDAIDAASPGDTIKVYDGTYYEHIYLNNSITLIGNGSADTIIDGGGTGTVITVNANWCNITRLTVTGSGSLAYDAGINISSDFNRIKYCNFTGNQIGIYLYFSDNNTISNSICYSNTNVGIYLKVSVNNLIYNNNFIDNTQNAYDESNNFWDDRYPSGGNYWDDYTGSDDYWGSHQNFSGSDRMGDTPYSIPGGTNQDRYPYINTTGWIGPAPWWDNSWIYRKQLVITNPLPDYQMYIQVWKEEGYDELDTGVIGCDGYCNVNFSDIRFVDNVTLLPYWIEKTGVTNGDHYANIWVKTSGNNVVYMYHGNPTATNVSDGANTWNFFDDFTSDTTGQFTQKKAPSHSEWYLYTRPSWTSDSKRIRYEVNVTSLTTSSACSQGIDIGSSADYDIYGDNTRNKIWGGDFHTTSSTKYFQFVTDNNGSSPKYLSTQEYIVDSIVINTSTERVLRGTFYDASSYSILGSEEVSDSANDYDLTDQAIYLEAGWSMSKTFTWDSGCEALYLKSYRRDWGQAEVKLYLNWYAEGKCADLEPTWTWDKIERPTHVYVDDNFNLNTIGWGYDFFDKNEDGIGGVLSSGTVFVYNGIYSENVVVNRPVTLIGESNVNTIIDGNGIGNPIHIATNGVNISGFKIKNSGVNGAGIHLSSSYNIISNNIIENNDYAIFIDNSDGNTLSNNKMLNCSIWLDGSLSNWNSHNIDATNTVNNKPVCYLKDQNGGPIPPTVGQIILANCNNLVVMGYDISNCSGGILIGYSNSNHILNNTYGSNIYGVYLSASYNNTISNNTCKLNKHGVYLSMGSTLNTFSYNNLVDNINHGVQINDANSGSNYFYYNYFINNNGTGIQASDNSTGNNWDSIGSTTSTIILGNYWSDWFSPDNNNDGIVDKTYNLTGSAGAKDYFPMCPIIIPPTNLTLYEDTFYSGNCIVRNVYLPGAFSFSTIPSWLTGLPNGSLSGTPTNDDVGTCWVNTSISDFCTTAYRNFTLDVINVNDRPDIDIMELPNATEDVFYSVSVEATDIDPTADTLTWSMTSNTSPFLSMDSATGNLSGTPGNDDVGSYWVNVTVSDEHGGYNATNFTLTVINTNDPPIINTTDITTCLEDQLYMVDYNATDIDPTGDTFTWSLDTDFSFLEIDSVTGVLWGTPRNVDVGTFGVKVSVSDGNGGTNSTNFTLTIHNTNDAPSIVTDDVTDAYEDSLYFCDYEGVDVDLEDADTPITWNLVTNASWLSIDESIGNLSGTPTNEDVGTYWVNVTVFDEHESSNSSNFTLTVHNTNDKPVWVNIPSSAKIPISQIYTFDVDASDIDVGDSLTYNIDSNPTTAITIESISGIIQWTPDELGTYIITLSVSDAEGPVYHEFTLTVVLTTSLISPGNNSVVDIRNLTFEWAFSGGDDDNTVTYDLYLCKLLWVVQGLNQTVGKMGDALTNTSFTPSGTLMKSLGKGTTYYWTVIPYDGENYGLCLEEIWSFTVAETSAINNLPEFQSDPSLEAVVGVEWTYEPIAIDEDEGDYVTISLVSGPDGMTFTSGVLRWTPTEAQLGNNEVKLKAIDNWKGSVFQEFTIVVVEHIDYDNIGDDEHGKSFLGGYWWVITGVIVIIIIVIFRIILRRKKKTEEELLPLESMEEPQPPELVTPLRYIEQPQDMQFDNPLSGPVALPSESGDDIKGTELELKHGLTKNIYDTRVK